jgi:DNA-binding MarR family transcriptional regulator
VSRPSPPSAAGPQDPSVILSPDLVALLQEMGLTWDEVRIYQFLLNSSSAISSAIVRETGHSRGRIYEALRRLVEKGLVREEPTRPIRFRPTPLSEILATAHERLTRQLAAVKAGQGVALALGTAQASVPLLAPTKPRDVRVLSGRRACHAEWRRMLGEAAGFFWLTGGERLANRLAAMPDFLRELRAAHDKGLNVQVVLPRNASTARSLEAMAALLGPDILHPATVDQFGPLVSCATDQASMEVISQPDDDALNRGDDVAIQVSSELFANASRRRMELAESFQRGEASAPYQWLGPNHGSDLFLDAVLGARAEVLVLGPAAWSTYLARDWQRNASTYRDAKGRGVTFRALTVRGADDPRGLEPFAHVWDIRIVPWHPVWLTLVDGKDLYQAFTHPSLGGPPQFRHSREPNEVRFYSEVFARLWATGEPVRT